MRSKGRLSRLIIVLLLLFVTPILFTPVSVYGEICSGPGGNNAGGGAPGPGSGEFGSATGGSIGGGIGGGIVGGIGGGIVDEPAEPCPAEIARAESLALEAYAQAAGIDVSQINQAVMEAMRDSVWESFGFTRAESDVRNASVTGDPVLVTTGQYVLEIEDISITGSAFAITRKYLSEESTIGSMGARWLTSVDSRIIRGVTRVNEDSLLRMETLAAVILNSYERIDKFYAADIAERVYTQIYLPAREKLDELYAIKTRGEQLAELNRLSLFPGSPEFFEGVGNDNLVLIDEDGIPKVFEPA